MKNKFFKSLNRLYSPIWLIILTFAVTIVLEYSTPPEYVFGYLYTSSILLTTYSFSKKTIWRVTVAAIALTLLNLFFPVIEPPTSATIGNRLIATIALGATGWLCLRTRRYEEAVARSQEKLRAQEQLAALREDFVSTLTHDLKTPLLGAIETIKAFRNEQFGEITSIQAKVLAKMESSHRSSLQLVQTLLDVYRNDAEGLKLKCEPLDLAAIASEVIASLVDIATARQVYVILNYGNSDFRSHFLVSGDALQLQRVFSNLIINGIDHSLRGGKVEVQLQRDKKFYLVKIFDGGRGITVSELPHLFERFYQGGSERSSSGSGLGLYLARQIIEAHGGKIWAENRSPQGAIFSFCIPALSE